MCVCIPAYLFVENTTDDRRYLNYFLLTQFSTQLINNQISLTLTTKRKTTRKQNLCSAKKKKKNHFSCFSLNPNSQWTDSEQMRVESQGHMNTWLTFYVKMEQKLMYNYQMFIFFQHQRQQK